MTISPFVEWLRSSGADASLIAILYAGAKKTPDKPATDVLVFDHEGVKAKVTIEWSILK